MHSFRLLAAALVAGFTVPSHAAEALPAFFAASGLAATSDDTVSFENWGEAAFTLPGHADPVVQRGKHWTMGLTLSGAGNVDAHDLWSKIRPSLAKGGWTFPVETEDHLGATIRYQAAGHDAWATVRIFQSDDIRVELVDAGPQPLAFTLRAPAAKPEKIAADTGDFPYLAPLPGSTLQSGNRTDEPLMIGVEGQAEPNAVGTGFIIRDYVPAPHLSNVQFKTVYRDALAAAGWSLLSVSQGLQEGDSTLSAHYAKNGRDLWAALHMGGGSYTIAVADTGGDDLAAKLAKDCHVALYGVLFDFNKSTLKAESEPVLQRVLTVLQKDAALKIEVQGHTDNVGGDDYNQKLSEARAKAVADWLTAHGIAASRLTSKGYGLRQPVADNDSAEGRAKNRRVEIAKPGCEG